MNLINTNTKKDTKKDGKRKSTLISFLIASILLHLIIFFVISFYPPFMNRQVKPKEKLLPIEITDLPVPKEKETEPPKEVKRYAERSHRAPKEKTRDEFTKRGNIRSLPQPKRRPRQAQKPKEIKKAEEKPKKNKIARKSKRAQEKIAEKSPQIASLPEDIERDLESLREKTKEEKLASITKEKLFNIPPGQASPEGSQEFLGSRGVKQKEDTVDLNTTEFRYYSYFAKLKEQIERVWTYPEPSRLRGEQGELFLVFTIRRDGYLEDIELLDPSGYVRLDDEALRAIRVASPFSPFPKSWGGLERLNVRAAFRYEIRYGWSVR